MNIESKTILHFQNKRLKIKLPQAPCEKISLVNKFLDINIAGHLCTFHQNQSIKAELISDFR